MSQFPPPQTPPPLWPAAPYPPAPYPPSQQQPSQAPPTHWPPMSMPGAPPFGVRGAAGYPIPVQSARPGLVTAIAATSIIVASISLLASTISGFYGFRIFRVSQMSSQMNRGNSGASSTAIVPPGMIKRPDGAPAKPLVTALGMEEKDRQAVAAALQTFEAIPPRRLRQLEWLLAQDGQMIFPAGPEGASEAKVTAAITDHGNEPSANPRATPPLYFDTAAGRLLLYDNSAVFRPNAAYGRVIRSYAPPEPGGVTPGGGITGPNTAAGVTTDPLASDPNDPFAAPGTPPAFGGNPNLPGPGGLTPAEVQSVLAAAQKAANGRLNTAQLSAIQQALDTPGQQLITSQQVWSPVSMVQVQPDGSAVIRLGNGFMVVDAQGQVQTSMSALMPRISIHPLSIALVVGESLASAGLAAYLLVIAILTLRQSPRGKRFHQVYAAIKIPLAVTGGVAFAWLMTSLLNSLRTLNPGLGGSPSAGSAQVMATLGIVMAVAGLIYPVVLLIVLRHRSVKEYYDSVSTAR